MRTLAFESHRLRWVVACAGMSLPAYALPGPGSEPQSARDRTATPAACACSASPSDASAAEWTHHLSIGGGIALYYYQPTIDFPALFLVYSRLVLDARWQPFGLHFEPRLSSEKMRAYYDGLAWVQEAYLYAEGGPFTLKIGKVYKQLGLFTDNSFYGNIQVYEGLKYDPNAGASFEGRLGTQSGVAFWAQYFVTDGHTNSSLPGRDTISIPGARRRNTLAGRVQPYFSLGPESRLELGFSGEKFIAELPEPTPAHPDHLRHNHVWRVAVDAKLSWKGLGFWGEVLHQSGKNVDAYPYAADPTTQPPTPGRASGDNTYLLAGVEYTLGPAVARYDLSIARYSELSVQEVLHLPGLGVSFNEHASFLAEYAWWERFTPEGPRRVDRSINLTWMGHF
jgi:hypothetical protein